MIEPAAPPPGARSPFRTALAESPPLWWALLYFFCLLCGYYVLRPVRDAMGASSDIAAVFPPALLDWPRRAASLSVTSPCRCCFPAPSW